jgi:hypothetical protein
MADRAWEKTSTKRKEESITERLHRRPLFPCFFAAKKEREEDALPFTLRLQKAKKKKILFANVFRCILVPSMSTASIVRHFFPPLLPSTLLVALLTGQLVKVFFPFVQSSKRCSV